MWTKISGYFLGCYPYDASSHSAPRFRAFIDNKLQEYNIKLDSSQDVVSDNEIKMLAILTTI
jgi:hypothetical protein